MELELFYFEREQSGFRQDQSQPVLNKCDDSLRDGNKEWIDINITKYPTYYISSINAKNELIFIY